MLDVVNLSFSHSIFKKVEEKGDFSLLDKLKSLEKSIFNDLIIWL